MPESEIDRDLACLRSTSDARERNALALSLGDRRVPGLPDVLVELIQREALRNHRGTLVYVLGWYDCAPYYELLTELMLTGGFEVAEGAACAMENSSEAPSDVVERIRHRLRGGSPESEPEWRLDLVNYIREILE